MTSRRTRIQERIHIPILRILQDKSDLSRRKLSELLSMGVGAAELLPQSPHRLMTNEIARAVGRFGQNYDPSKPCKLMIGSRSNSSGWQAQTPLSSGLQLTHADFLEANA